MRILAQIMGGNLSFSMRCDPHEVVVSNIRWDSEFSFAKGWYHYKKLQNIRQFDLIWLLDSDMDVDKFDCVEFMKAWSRNRPLISQPTMSGYNVNKMFSYKLWSKNNNLEKGACLNSHWIEQQAPLFNSSFLEWFHKHDIVKTVFRLQRKYNVDWGLDFIWCGAAREFDKHHPIPCACINVPCIHNNTKTQKWNGGYVNRGFHLLSEAKLRKDLPCWPPTCCSLHPWFYEHNSKITTFNKEDIRRGWLPNAPVCMVA